MGPRTARWKGVEDPLTAAVVDELRLDPDLYTRLRQRAAIRLMSAEGRAAPASLEQAKAHLDDFRRDKGLFQRADLDEWIVSRV